MNTSNQKAFFILLLAVLGWSPGPCTQLGKHMELYTQPRWQTLTVSVSLGRNMYPKPSAHSRPESPRRCTSIAGCSLGMMANHVHLPPSMHLGHRHKSALLTGIRAEAVCGENCAILWLWPLAEQQGNLGVHEALCSDIYPSQASENRELPLKSSKPNGFHRVFHHESV